MKAAPAVSAIAQRTSLLVILANAIPATEARPRHTSAPASENLGVEILAVVMYAGRRNCYLPGLACSRQRLRSIHFH
jgi:hypothetical protein